MLRSGEVHATTRRPESPRDADFALRIDFKRGEPNPYRISARIEDTNWLRSFQAREIDVRPGDALRCLATVEHSYGFDNELISENVTITK